LVNDYVYALYYILHIHFTRHLRLGRAGTKSSAVKIQHHDFWLSHVWQRLRVTFSRGAATAAAKARAWACGEEPLAAMRRRDICRTPHVSGEHRSPFRNGTDRGTCNETENGEAELHLAHGKVVFALGPQRCSTHGGDGHLKQLSPSRVRGSTTAAAEHDIDEIHRHTAHKNQPLRQKVPLTIGLGSWFKALLPLSC
jgi:hypothetical protein